MLAETERLLSKWPANRPPEEQYAFLADFPDASGIDLSSTPDPARDFRTAGALIEFQQESKS